MLILFDEYFDALPNVNIKTLRLSFEIILLKFARHFHRSQRFTLSVLSVNTFEWVR